MLALKLTDDYSFELSDIAEPALPAGGAILRLVGCGLCGSDLDKIIHKKVSPGTILGHEVVGIIEYLDPQAPLNWSIGDRVVAAHHVPCGVCHYCANHSQSMCRQFKASNLIPGGFSEKIALSQDHLAHTVFRIPSHISDEAASCVEPLACVLQAFERSKPPLSGGWMNGSVAIIGLGFMGLLAGQVYQEKGLSVFGLDIDPARLTFARTHSLLNQVFHAQHEFDALLNILSETTSLGKTDVVFLTVVTPQTWKQALDLVRDGGTIVLFTSPIQGTDTDIDPTVLYFREIQVVPSYSPSLKALREASEWVFEGRIQVEPLVTHRVDFSELPIHLIKDSQSGEALKVFVKAPPPPAPIAKTLTEAFAPS